VDGETKLLDFKPMPDPFDLARPSVFRFRLNLSLSLNPPIALPDLPGTLPKPCNAGFVGIEWFMEILWHHVLHFQKVPLQGFYSVPAESVVTDYCNIKVNLLVS
jgi:hypothetical protein